MKNSHIHVLLAGGGSGGHVTPLKAIYDTLLDQTSADSVSVTVIVDRGFSSQARRLFDGDKVKMRAIFAGKYRRYHNKSFLWHIIHLPTFLKNIRDIFYLGIGLLQSLTHIIRRKPDVVFCKGGFVCVPVGLATRILRIPLVIHDSDARPGLTNTLLSRWAVKIGTGMPTEFYPYDKGKVSYTGIPVSSTFTPVSAEKQRQYKRQLDFDGEQPVLLITGGGNGADSLNKKVSNIVGELLDQGWGIVHLAGKGKASALLQTREKLPATQRDNWHIEEFADMAPCMLAADVVLARTSASTLQECANAKKCVIGVPSPHLEDQSMNAAFFASKQAIIAVDQEVVTDKELIQTINGCKGQRAATYAQMLHDEFARPSAAAAITKMIVSAATAGSK